MTSLTYSLVKDIACEQALDEDGTNSAKFGKRNDRGGTGQIMIPYSGIMEWRHQHNVYRLPRFVRARRIIISGVFLS